ncbi:Uncharacterised protein [Mycobacteroides abscessus subsp. massiliense]|nr:Uncharacterised protein [Mycobacteroides abscessus subsp. massiliense]
MSKYPEPTRYPRDSGSRSANPAAASALSIRDTCAWSRFNWSASHVLVTGAPVRDSSAASACNSNNPLSTVVATAKE